MTNVKLICPLEVMIKCLFAFALRKLRKLRLKLNSNAEFLPLGVFNLTVETQDHTNYWYMI